MKFLLVLSILIPAPAFACRILHTFGDQQFLEEFGDGYLLQSGSKEEWNTCKDGPLPADAPVGYAERVEGRAPKLRENLTMKAAKEKRDAEKADEALVKEQQKAACVSLWGKVDGGSAMTAAELRTTLGCVRRGM